MGLKGIAFWLFSCFLQKPEITTEFLSLAKQGQRGWCGIVTVTVECHLLNDCDHDHR